MRPDWFFSYQTSAMVLRRFVAGYVVPDVVIRQAAAHVIGAGM